MYTGDTYAGLGARFGGYSTVTCEMCHQSFPNFSSIFSFFILSFLWYLGDKRTPSPCMDDNIVMVTEYNYRLEEREINPSNILGPVIYFSYVPSVRPPPPGSLHATSKSIPQISLIIFFNSVENKWYGTS